MPKKTLGDIGARPRKPTFLRAWRDHRGLSQWKAAEQIGVSYTTVGRKERGANVDQAYLEAAARVYRCEVIDILERPPWASPGGDEIIAEAQAEVGRILKRSIEATRGQPPTPPVPDGQQLQGPKAPPRGPKSPKQPPRPKHP